jgi:type VII secretion-associated serine protease mycosin
MTGNCPKAWLGAAIQTLIVISFVSAFAAAAPANADTIRDQQWVISALQVTTAHRLSEGDGVIVAVIDTGVDSTHPDLSGNVLSGVDLTSAVPNAPGRVDVDGHGTGMAALVAGHGHGKSDGNGVLGIAPRARILPIRLTQYSSGDGGGTGRAVQWAVAHGADVISMSYTAALSDAQAANAIVSAERANVVLVAAAGNTTQGAKGVGYPAAYAGVLAVGGTTKRGEHSVASVVGGSISISAPADDIVTAYKDGGYAVGSGTSSSTAIVAGAAALVRSRFPNLTASQVIDRLTETAIDRGPPGRDDEYGYGLLNIVGALTAKLPVRTPSLSPTEVGSSPQPVPPTTTSGAAPARESAATAIVVISALVVLVVATAAWLYARRRARPRGP